MGFGRVRALANLLAAQLAGRGISVHKAGASVSGMIRADDARAVQAVRYSGSQITQSSI